MSGGRSVEVAFVRQDFDAPPAETTAVRLLWLLRAHLPHGLRVESERIRLRLALPEAGATTVAGDALTHRACAGWSVEN
ncbi:hypothetical protein DMB38_19855 [Streptomyces sp. WAC 06738]|uniref:hypothetical protein n=1 Tax=Streptomyces sp. WAC 06738 TaxID=2203210 RepID=UPI000F6DDF69|nr:hypothetical protein [Streptomyces sp. WAC 06738]AZM47735.1 hypothetical protein DMB38_19855 [Streptomyces sp. WAC 06738]